MIKKRDEGNGETMEGLEELEMIDKSRDKVKERENKCACMCVCVCM